MTFHKNEAIRTRIFFKSYISTVDLIHNSYSIAVGIKLKQGNEYQLGGTNENSFISNLIIIFQLEAVPKKIEMMKGMT